MHFLKTITKMILADDDKEYKRNCSVKMIWAAIFLSFLFNQAAIAGPLIHLVELAHKNEPKYLSVKEGVKAAQARADQAFGQLLPQVNATFSTDTNNRDYLFRDAPSSVKARFNTNAKELNLTQPIFKYDNLLAYRQAKVGTKKAEEELADAEQELLTQLVSSWMMFLEARDQTIFTQQQINLFEYKLRVAKKAYELGAVGQPELDDLTAKLEQAYAEDVSAKTDLGLQRATLEQLVGDMTHLKPAFLRENAEFFDLKSETIGSVLNRVEVSNHKVKVAERAFDAASAEVRKQHAGHYPSLDLVARYSDNAQGAGGFPGQAGSDIKLATVGLQLNVPIYSGGSQSAKVVEAAAEQQKALYEIEAAKRQSILTAKKAWYGWHAAKAKTDAAQKVVTAAKSSLKAASVAAKAGLKSEDAVLEAQQQLSSAEKDYNKSRYDQLDNYIKLKSTMGELTFNDFIHVDNYFEHDHWTLRLKRNNSVAQQ